MCVCFTILVYTSLLVGGLRNGSFLSPFSAFSLHSLDDIQPTMVLRCCRVRPPLTVFTNIGLYILSSFFLLPSLFLLGISLGRSALSSAHTAAATPRVNRTPSSAARTRGAAGIMRYGHTATTHRSCLRRWSACAATFSSPISKYVSV